jgi:class 3 adenylate cyclase
VVQFLGQFRDPVDHTELTSPFRTILFTDLEGSTEMAVRLETSVFMSMLAEHDGIIRQSLLASGGHEV